MKKNNRTFAKDAVNLVDVETVLQLIYAVNTSLDTLKMAESDRHEEELTRIESSNKLKTGLVVAASIIICAFLFFCWKV